jgi:NAD(P)-dependent dehydrogenase (short-subunit alcohol dehydrogenase family)
MTTAVVTGANRGIGLELCKQLKQRGAEVIGVCRSSSPELDGLGVRVESGVDVGQDASVAELGKRLGGKHVDLVVNNAGILERETLDEMNFGSIRKQLEVNSLGPLRVTSALLPSLGKGSKVVIVTSRMGSIADNTSGSRYGYRMSKAAVNMAGKSLAIDLKPRGVAVAIVHPGFVRTDMTGKQGDVDAATAAGRILDRADALDLDSSGTFWHANGEVLPW